MLSNGDFDTPPVRVVQTARTQDGTGQSGVSQRASGEVSNSVKGMLVIL
jgi:hypothetical protein